MAKIQDLKGYVGGEVKIHTSAGLCYKARLKKIEFGEKGAKIEVEDVMEKSRGSSVWVSLNNLPPAFLAFRDADFSSSDKLENGTVHLNSIVLGNGGLLYIFSPSAEQKRVFA